MTGKFIASRLASAVLVTACALGGLATQAPVQAASTPSLLSSAPKTIVISSATGAILSIRTGVPAISRHDVCNTSDACYYGEVPYANEGFYGSAGTYSGSWPERYEFGTGKYTARACWSSHCTPELGPTTYTVLTSEVTGTSVTIYS